MKEHFRFSDLVVGVLKVIRMSVQQMKTQVL